VNEPRRGEHLQFLSRPGAVRRLWIIFIAVLAVTVIAEFAVHMHAEFSLAKLFSFNAVYGFAACAAIIVFAKALGVFLKRPDTYYEDGTGQK